MTDFKLDWDRIARTGTAEIAPTTSKVTTFNGTCTRNIRAALTAVPRKTAAYCTVAATMRMVRTSDPAPYSLP